MLQATVLDSVAACANQEMRSTVLNAMLMTAKVRLPIRARFGVHPCQESGSSVGGAGGNRIHPMEWTYCTYPVEFVIKASSILRTRRHADNEVQSKAFRVSTLHAAAVGDSSGRCLAGFFRSSAHAECPTVDVTRLGNRLQRWSAGMGPELLSVGELESRGNRSSAAAAVCEKTTRTLGT